MVTMKYNNRKQDITGLNCAIDSTGEQRSVFDRKGHIKKVTVIGSIKVDGEILPEAFLSLDIPRGKEEVVQPDTPWTYFDLGEVQLEIDIFGKSNSL